MSDDSKNSSKSRTEDLEQDLRELADALSHDLRAPLRAVDGFSRALGEECQGVTPRGMEYLGWIAEATQRMGRQIEALVGLARLSTAELRPTTVDLGQLAGEVIRELQASESERAALVDVELADGMIVTGDARLLRTLLESLLSNAWNFTRPVANPRLAMGRRVEGERSVFFVTDNGVGFNPGQTERLFQPFCRLHNVDDAPVGMGVGLARARRVVARHGGSLWGQANPGGGATFSFTLTPPG